MESDFNFFFYFLLFSFGIENWSEGIEIFISPPTQLSFSLQLPYKCVVAARSLAGLPLPGAASLAFGLLRPKPLPPLSLFLSLCPACSLTGRDRSSRRSASISVVGHPPLGHPSSAFCLRRIWRPVMYPSTLKKVLSGDAFSLSLCASHFPS
jgi:hypothetical protein